MRRLAWTPRSQRAFKRLVKRNPQLKQTIRQTLELLVRDPFEPSLRTHKLSGSLEDVWSCSIDYKLRILFEFVDDPEMHEQAILLLNLGSHDEVY
ncbi:type II toxin-antitoxin system YafQ family toxin [Phormidium tenue]|uniref:Plasmid stabilization protein n=1 Tax=Phormidium tenue NIES-30 TaxID=549789 RepID=A0A1U7IZW7_9CYAN|nr:type II toxin-antitoxin system mRNA interferase toxin, RelE/StbE family [Phormidium tenue]MBD2231681.1 type II toxin-antitoxin system mRNA interferase toxin, RelE/StbE family [Phormidium tenue FACHB-1052]OKH44819.1 plasmid stabilization protein [Phormidium tenue NIES-30]